MDEFDNLVFLFNDAMDNLELALLEIDEEGLIIQQNRTSKLWFGDVLYSKYRDFCGNILHGMCEIDSVEVLAKNSKKYKIASIKLKDNHTFLIFKEMADSIIDLSSEEDFSENSYVLDRREFIKNIKNIIYEADIIHSKVALLFIEVANLAYIIDSYNKKISRNILNIVSRRLKNSLRESDVIGQFDYNTFAVAINGIDGLDIPKKISKKILYNISRPIATDDGGKIDIDVLIGISIYPDNSKNIDDLISLADSRRYSTKIKSRKWLLSFI